MRGLFLEVIVCSVADAVAAEEGGADRLEVARAMDLSGLTPPIDLVREIQRAVRLPLRAMYGSTTTSAATGRGNSTASAKPRANWMPRALTASLSASSATAFSTLRRSTES